PVSMIKAPRGYILISIEVDYSPMSRPSTLVFTLVSEQGDTLLQRRHALSITPGWFSGKNVVLDLNKNLVVAIGGNLPASSSVPGPSLWTNPKTGTGRFCATPDASEVFELDVRSLDLKAKKTIENVSIVSLKLNDGRLYAASSFVRNCELNK